MKRYIPVLCFLFILCSILSVTVFNVYASDIPSVSVDNYTVTVTEADSIRDMRYAPGVYTTAAEIKAAEGNVALSEKIVADNTANGIFRYEMPKGGYYTLWIRMNDGTNRILPLDVTNFTPCISAYGVKITVRNLYDVKDLFIAKGKYSSYRELKNNGYIVSVSGAKIGSKHDYTYTVSEPGVHTVLIRYNDGTQKLFHETLSVDEPVFTENGLQLIISNLPDVKVIRTAYGEWNTVKELKATDTIRNFSSKTAIEGKDPYTVQYRTEGKVTVIVEYNNGYLKVYHYNVTKKLPKVTQTDDTVTFTELDGLKLIRYAEGKYDSAAEIKASPVSKILKPADTVDGEIRVTLPEGTFTFCVQYSDESYSFHTVSVEPAAVMSDSFTKELQYTDTQGNTLSSLPYWLYTPADTGKDMPLVVILHSALTKTDSKLTSDENLDNMVNSKNDDIPGFIYNGDMGDIPAYIIMPQIDSSSRGWAKRGKELTELIKYCTNRFNIDENAVTVMGYSLGGTGAIELAAAYPEMFSKVIAVAAGLDGVTNNTRPYIQNSGRLALSDNYYPELRVLNSAQTAYEKETMKYLYAADTSRYLASTEAEKLSAKRFEAQRITEVAESLGSEGIAVWMIAAANDTEVEPAISQALFNAIAKENTLLTVADDRGHNTILKELLNRKKEITDFILHAK